MHAKEFTSCNHVALLPDKNKATFINLFKHFFFSRNLGQSELLYQSGYSDEHENKILHRLMIFVSIFIQILLKHLSKPLKKFGTVLEDFLNRGVTQSDSDRHISFLGHCDTRLDLDKTIKRGNAKYYPALSMMASKLAYENKAVIKMAITEHWKMEFVKFYDFYNEFQHKSTTQACIFREPNVDGDRIIVAFRGTSMFVADDWSTDFDFSWLKIDGMMGKTHLGFMMALGLNKYSHEDDDYLGDFCGSWPKEIQEDPQHPLAYYTIREKLKEMMVNNPNAKFIVTGHSLGGALAVLFPSVLALHGEVELLDKLEAIYTYGQPRVGDEEFGQFMKKSLRKHNIKYYRIIYSYDIVPKVPLDDALMTFKHFGKGIHFNCFYQGKIVEEERERDGYIVLWLLKTIIVMIINFIVARISALWELIRGFSIGLVKGTDYKEGWLFTFLRVIGMIAPEFHKSFSSRLC